MCSSESSEIGIIHPLLLEFLSVAIRLIVRHNKRHRYLTLLTKKQVQPEPAH